MWDELERKIDYLFEEYFKNEDNGAKAEKNSKNGDNGAEAKEQLLVNCAVDNIRKLLHTKDAELYYKEESLGYISIEDEEIMEWVTDFLKERKRKSYQKKRSESFQNYLNETIRVEMWYKTELNIDCLIQQCSENSNDYNEEEKKQLVDCAVENIKKLLYLENGKLYYKGECLGIISFQDKEIREWIAGFLKIGVNESAAKPFHDYLNETIHQAMRNKLVPAIDRLFEEYFEKHDYTAEAKKQLANCAVESIRKLLHPKNGELYYIEKRLGYIYIDDAEIRNWVTNYLEDGANGSAAKPFHEYLDEMILQAANLQWKQADNQRRDWDRIKNAANYYALEYLKEKKSVIRKERENLWTENAKMAWVFASKLVIEKNGTYEIIGREFNASLFGDQQSKDRNGFSKAEFSNEVLQKFLKGYNYDDAAFCGSYLQRSIKNYYKDTRRNAHKQGDQDTCSGTAKQGYQNNMQGLESLDKPIDDGDGDGPAIGCFTQFVDTEGDIKGAIRIFVNWTKALSDFTRIQNSVKGRNSTEKVVRWHRFLVLYLRSYVDEICQMISSSGIRKIDRDIDIIFRTHYKKFESETEGIVDYTDCSVCQTYIFCLEHEETKTEKESIAEIRKNKPAYVNAFALQEKVCSNQLIFERFNKKGYLNQYFEYSNFSNIIREYYKMITMFRNQGKLDRTDEERDAYIYWLNTRGRTYGIYDEEEVIKRYSGQKLELRFGIISDEKLLCYLQEVRDGGDQLILTQFPVKLTDIGAITRGIAQAYRIAVIIFDNIYGKANILRTYESAEDYSRIKRDQIIKKLRNKRYPD